MPPKDYSYTGVKDPSIIKEEIIMPSTIENIDIALHEYINNTMDLHSTTNKGWEKTPIIWASAERSYQIKHNKDLRDNNGTLILPVIVLERGSFEKSLTRKGPIYGGVVDPNSAITVAKIIKQDKTQNFANADSKRVYKDNNYPFDNKKVVYQTATMPLPTYLDITYTVNLRTEYQQQLNELTVPFANLGKPVNYFTISRNKHFYEAFVDSNYSLESNITNLGEEERRYETKVTIKVLGYVLGDDKNQKRPKIVYRENAVEVRIGRERSIFGDKPWNISPDELEYRD
tara:strand:+ start:1673 stop:2533 length:861 start_codon:yes stop_codon:yes gene_type:complete